MDEIKPQKDYSWIGYIALLVILIMVAYTTFKPHPLDSLQIPKGFHVTTTCQWQACKGLQQGQNIPEENCTTGYECVDYTIDIIKDGFTR